MTERKSFCSLVDNAFDFLEKAISEFPDSPKYSVINFYTAVELILKARLLKEHWSLIVLKPELASIEKFNTGDFQSVGLKETQQRLKNIARSGISDQAFKSFDDLAKHRNKQIHFFNEHLEKTKESLDQIVTEQSNAWFYLHQLMTGQWKKYFKKWSKKIIHFNETMKNHRSYLSAKYEQLKQDIRNKKAKGIDFAECQLCGFESAQIKEVAGSYSFHECVVCDHIGSAIEIECASCSNEIILNEGYDHCPHCDHSFTPEELIGILLDHDSAQIAFQDGDNSFDLGNCAECGSYHTVIRYHDIYICTCCLDSFDQVGQCDWCNELNTGNLEYSYQFGCSHCEGSEGWHKDD